ncbi:hypothetical protein QU926_13595 [Pseudomonas asiatica]|uniref:hypothetical protein n=1 Tax=Pseudomonas asiatica TaxID=2219225 RepID=UPI0025AB0A5D|nr:hypothetical protein [Pseudomonas asiatica]MDM9554681.1 hypothetical protein [Pseudomonas asiatica]
MEVSRWCDKYELAYFEHIGERYLFWDADRLIPIEHAVVLGFCLEDLSGVDWIVCAADLVPGNVRGALTRFMRQGAERMQGQGSNLFKLDAKSIEAVRLNLTRGSSYV